MQQILFILTSSIQAKDASREWMPVVRGFELKLSLPFKRHTRTTVA